MPISSTPSALRAILIGCAQAFAWFVLLILQILAEPILRLAQRARAIGFSAGWLEVFLGALLFVLMLGLLLVFLPRYRERRALAWLLLGWAGGGLTLFVVFALLLARYGGLVAGGAG
jgi:hypothetical protein